MKNISLCLIAVVGLFARYVPAQTNNSGASVPAKSGTNSPTTAKPATPPHVAPDPKAGAYRQLVILSNNMFIVQSRLDKYQADWNLEDERRKLQEEASGKRRDFSESRQRSNARRAVTDPLNKQIADYKLQAFDIRQRYGILQPTAAEERARKRTEAKAAKAKSAKP